MKAPALIIEPVTAAECTPEWIEIRRDIIARGQYPTRAGAGSTIEIRSNTPVEQLAGWDPLKANPWVPLILPNGARQFTTAEDRDAVLVQLQGKQ